MTATNPFPNLGNIDVYKYENNFDYSRFTPNARLKLCNVPWCGDYENVVKFADNAARDAWFDAQDGDTVDMETMFNIKPNGSVKVPVPITSAVLYNYVIVDLPRMTSDAQPIAYAGGARVRRYFYFIEDAIQLSPNNTKLAITLDVWTTYINDMNFDYVLLERGHAPVAISPVNAYLENPRSQSAYLLSNDVNTGGEPYIETKRRVKNYSADDQRACIATYADLQGDFGSASAPKVPALVDPDISGVLAQRVYALPIPDLQPFLTALEGNAPWMKSSISGIFFAPAELLIESGAFDLYGCRVAVLDAVQKVERFIKPTKADFAYPEQARNFSKLYTWPYAAIRISDERGGQSMVRVEDLGGDGIEVASAVNLVMPYVAIEARLLGIAGVADTLTFQTLDQREYSYGGAWGDYLKRWDIPVMQVSQSAASRAGWSSVYERAHARFAADNALASSLASNATARDNVARSAQTSVDNNEENCQSAEDIRERNATLSNDIKERLNSNISAIVSIDNATTDVAADVKNDVAALSGIANAGNSIASAGITAVASGPLAAASGAAGVISSAVTTVVSQSSNSAFAELAKTQNSLKATEQRLVNNYINDQQVYATRSNLNRSNEAARANTGRSAGTANDNAGATKSTADANANRAHDTAIDAIQARLNQAGTAEPVTYGEQANGYNCAISPRALFAQIVTQRECDVMNAASAFARYGYALMREWSMKDMQVMKHFTYWKCAEVWCSGRGNVIEGAQAAIKDIFVRGVTVWEDPDNIGNVSIYDNF